VIGRPPGTIKLYFRARVAQHPSPNPPR
jgi:hypothetical protein